MKYTTEEERRAARRAARMRHYYAHREETNAKQRLEQLESLKSSGLITQREYEEKREEIIARL